MISSGANWLPAASSPQPRNSRKKLFFLQKPKRTNLLQHQLATHAHPAAAAADCFPNVSLCEYCVGFGGVGESDAAGNVYATLGSGLVACAGCALWGSRCCCPKVRASAFDGQQGVGGLELCGFWCAGPEGALCAMKAQAVRSFGRNKGRQGVGKNFKSDSSQ